MIQICWLKQQKDKKFKCRDLKKDNIVGLVSVLIVSSLDNASVDEFLTTTIDKREQERGKGRGLTVGFTCSELLGFDHGH